MGQTFRELTLGQEFYFQWHITEQCNLRCKHCYHEKYESSGQLNLTSLLQVLDQIDNAVAKWGKLASLSITGGEPLLRLEELKSIVDHLELKHHVYYFDILTNGILLDEDIVSLLSRSNKLRRVQLSLEGPDDATNDMIRGRGSFRKIVNRIDLLKKKGIPVSVMVTLTRDNRKEIPSFVALAKEIDVDYLSFERFIPQGNGTELKDQLLSREELRDAFELISKLAEQEKEVRILTYRPLFALCSDNGGYGAMCSAGTNALTIMHNGVVYPCRRLPLPLGHILKDSLYKIWYDSEILWKIRDCRNLRGKCNGCELRPACRGCRAMAYFVNGDYLAEDPQCWK
ncbi:MAG: radical SAM protein [Firmicutes bacterium]|nr:radical SAM protein [Bacillota bacterium]